MRKQAQRQPSVDDEISRKLDIVIGLLAELCARSDQSTETRQRIRLLHQLGLPAPDIAPAVGKTRQYVNATLSQLRRQKTKRKASSDEH